MRARMITVGEQAALSIDRVLIIDDHPLFCEALRTTLADLFAVRQVSVAHSLTQALNGLRAGPMPDAILLDLNLPDVAGLDGLARLLALAPGLPVIVVSSMSDARVITAVVQAGAAGFVPKDSTRAMFDAAFRAIWSGQTYVPPGHAMPKSRSAQAPVGDVMDRLADLTPQQGRILALVCRGLLNKQIAHELSITETTVKAHVTAILRKLGAQSRTQAVRIANDASFAALMRTEI